MHRSGTRGLLLLAALLMLLVLGGCRGATVGQAASTRSQPDPEQTAAPSASKPAANQPTAAPSKPAANQPAGGASKPAAERTAAPASSKPAGSADVDRERIARDATWAPGQLAAHFEKHGEEGPWASESAYDASAREVIRVGTLFTYVDGTANVERLGFYHRDSNRFTAVTRDGRRITTQFRPDRGEAYVRGLARSSYR
jgi:pyocin large subunit-like protein